MTDLDIIKQLEQEIGKKLPETSLDNITSSYDNGYAVDEKKNVVGLNLAELELVNIPESLVLLKNLQELSLVGNKIAELPESFAQLQNLSHLELQNNQLQELPASFGQLQNLSHLNLQENQLQELPAWFGELKKLQKLCLNKNKISQLSKEILDFNLDLYWIDWYELYDKKESGISLKDNPLTSPPPEVIKQGQQAIIDYFQSLEEEKKPLHEVKILLVGDGGVGKTSVVKQLLEQEFDPQESKTHGINIKPYYIATKDKQKQDIQVKTHLWDFGGQQIMHATHQFFLSKRSVYILVLDERKEEDPEYWLKHIESFGGNSPILVVLNKVDDNHSFELNRPFLQQKYPSIHSFHRVSCKKPSGIKTLRTALSKSLTEVEILQEIWGERWFNIKTELENLQHHFISHKNYQTLCEQQNIPESAQKTLVQYLHDLGVIIHFDSFDLKDTYVLEPKWVTEAVYKIINSEQLAENKGVLKLECLPHILQKQTETDYEYPLEKHIYIIRLMEKFELCYKIDVETILIPDLLDIPEPAFDFDYTNTLQFKIEYDFLPRSIMPKLIVKQHQDIRYQWRTGVVLHDRKYRATAVIKADNKDQHIQIWVTGQQKRDYFSTVRKTLLDIHRSFEKMDVTELVPLPDKDRRGETVYVEYEELIGYYEAGRDEYFVGKLHKEYSVKKLLDGIENLQQTQSHVTYKTEIHGDVKNANLNQGNQNQQSNENKGFFKKLKDLFS